MSLTLRLTLTYLVITLVGLLLPGAGLIVLAEHYAEQQQQRELQAQTELYAGFVAELASTPAELRSLAPDLVSGRVLPGNTTVRIFAPTGALLTEASGLGPFPSRAVLPYVSNPLPIPVSHAANRRYAAYPIIANEGTIGVVELSRVIMAEERPRNRLGGMVVQTALAAALVMALVSVLVARSIARPIIRLTRHAEQLTAGNAQQEGRIASLESPTTPAGHGRLRNEIAVLAQSLDYMAEQLQARIAETERERARLAAVLTSISEGVVALDTNRKLLFANPAALTLLGTDNQSEITDRLTALNLTPNPTAPIEHEAWAGQRQLHITISPIASTTPAGSGRSLTARIPATVWVLRDITRLKELEKARAQFFRSISHDLRTPLTIMRGVIENLRDVAPADQQPTFSTLEAETARLTRMVDDLLRSSSDGALLPAEYCLLQLDDLVRELCGFLKGRADRTGLTLTCEIQARLPAIQGDRDRLKQAVLNLLDNAFKATPTGGVIRVQVMLAQFMHAGGGACVRLSVTDTGPGVPPDLRERIWERGVRGTEPAASGTEPTGSGLGLAIVREIATAHGGQVWLDEKFLRGARFVLDLPIASPDIHPSRV